MVDIKGLDKARVLKALYDYSPVMGDFRCLRIFINDDCIEEHHYDRYCGKGTAQRAVDSVRAGKQDGGDAAKDAVTEKKELTMEEKVKLTKDAIEEILKIMEEIPPEMYAAACIVLKTVLPGPSMGGAMGMLTMMGGPIAPPFPFRGRFG